MKNCSFESNRDARAMMLGIFGVVVFALALPLAHCKEIDKSESEVERLEKLRNLIRRESNGRLKLARSPGINAPACKTMLKDLLSGVGFSPIEPVEIVSENESNDKPWRYCWNAEANGDEQRARRLFLSFSIGTGGAPFRIYKLPNEINPYPSADLFFFQEKQPAPVDGLRDRGFNWVDLKKCEYVGGLGNLAEGRDFFENPQGHQVALTQYAKGLAVWSVAENYGYIVDFLLPRKNNNHSGSQLVGQSCLWITHAEEN